jgi:hypothetical protein
MNNPNLLGLLTAIIVVGSGVLLGADVKPQIVLLKTYVTTNHISAYVTGGTPDCPTCLVAITHAAHDEVVTNYVLGFYNGTNAVELIAAEKR